MINYISKFQRYNIKTLRGFIIIFLTTIVLGMHFLFIYLMLPGPLEGENIIIIEPKTKIKQISAIMYQNQIIRNEYVFRIVASIYSRIKQPLKSGEYQFTHKVTPLQVIRILSSGKSVIHKLILPEGSTVNEVISKIENENRLIGSIQENITEGFLMPSTYFYTFRDQRNTLISQMKNLMSNILDELMPNLKNDSPLKTRMDVLTLASIIEKEAYFDDEKPKIAAVFLNRLKRNMKLQADPTTIYSITQGKTKFIGPLTKAQLRNKSPYNTYHVFGLPPTPIACPGRKSIEAVISPAITKDLYFVVDGSGRHKFAETLEQHNINVANYRKLKSK